MTHENEKPRDGAQQFCSGSLGPRSRRLVKKCICFNINLIFIDVFKTTQPLVEKLGRVCLMFKETRFSTSRIVISQSHLCPWFLGLKCVWRYTLCTIRHMGKFFSWKYKKYIFFKLCFSAGMGCPHPFSLFLRPLICIENLCAHSEDPAF